MRPILIASILLFSAGCSYFFPSHRIVIINESNAPLEILQVTFPGGANQFATLGPGKSKLLRYRATSDGGVKISFTQSGKALSEDLGYVAANTDYFCEVFVYEGRVSAKCLYRRLT